MPPGRPGKPMFPAPSPLDEAFDDLDQGSLSFDGAAEFTSFSVRELKRAVSAGEIETFHRGRRTLLVKRSVQMWLAKMLAEERRNRAAKS